MKKWPFKSLKQNSSWPLQGLVVQFAAAIISLPLPQRAEAANKMIERCIRMGARLASEFDMDAVTFVEIAKAQIVREVGPSAQQALKDAFGEAVAKEFDKQKLDDFAVQITEVFKHGSSDLEA